MKCFGLPRICRVTRSRDFEDILGAGSKAATDGVVLWWKPAKAGSERTRLGIMASRKLGGAVIRNRVKRYIREAFRCTTDFAGHFDMVLYPRTEKKFESLDASRNTLLHAWRKAGLIRKDEGQGQ